MPFMRHWHHYPLPNKKMVNRIDPQEEVEGDFEDFASGLENLIEMYAKKLSIGELISTLQVTQHSLISQSLNHLKDLDDED